MFSKAADSFDYSEAERQFVSHRAANNRRWLTNTANVYQQSGCSISRGEQCVLNGGKFIAFNGWNVFYDAEIRAYIAQIFCSISSRTGSGPNTSAVSPQPRSQRISSAVHGTQALRMKEFSLSDSIR